MILIYSSVVKFDAFARPKKPTTSYPCYDKTPLLLGGFAQTCCTRTDYGNGIVVTDNCQKCNYDDNGILIFSSCKDVDPPRTGQIGGVLTPPGNVGNALPPPGNTTGTLPPGSIIKVPPGTTLGNNIGNGTNPGNNTSTTTTVSPGIFKPTGNATNTPPPPTLLAKLPSGHHHHKGGQTSKSASNTNSTGY
jgi:hypothetical protein